MAKNVELIPVLKYKSFWKMALVNYVQIIKGPKMEVSNVVKTCVGQGKRSGKMALVKTVQTLHCLVMMVEVVSFKHAPATTNS